MVDSVTFQPEAKSNFTYKRTNGYDSVVPLLTCSAPSSSEVGLGAADPRWHASEGPLLSGFPTCALPPGSCACQSGAFCRLLLFSLSFALRLAVLFFSSHITQAHLFQTEHIKPRFLLKTCHSLDKGQLSPCPKAKDQLLSVLAGTGSSARGRATGKPASLVETWMSRISLSASSRLLGPWPGS